ncbi:hypothetical protein [Alteromonas lipolytica]|uniref:Uncharacterized protein n=1 Tax=Alteromonas lipolytica TaxID=1856405 RepID=A0A1E8FE62_9ALTE|nr:hypothetical protein [Alteromonas lipolytica]OFI34212.1 hypothetical protein BFC17_22000 [Alteromonas lipolytica]GGF84079.1 hypothetical protein GCM10011338_40470 [Alteromonas lipolytica]
MEDIIPLLGAITAGASTIIGLISAYRSKKKVEAELKTVTSTQKFLEFNRSEEDLRIATESLLNVIKDTENAVVQVGSLVLIKHKDNNGEKVVAMSLTNEQQSYLKEHPKILTKPKELLLRLREFDLPTSPLSIKGVIDTSNNTLQPSQKTRG